MTILSDRSKNAAIIKAIVEANSIRKDYISKKILDMNLNTIGVHRLIMKTGSDNFRDSSIVGIIDRLLRNDAEVIIYEPKLKESDISKFPKCRIVNDLESFKKLSDIIITNRIEEDIKDVSEKIYTRDIFNSD